LARFIRRRKASRAAASSPSPW